MPAKRVLLIHEGLKEQGSFRAAFSLIPDWCFPHYSLDVVSLDTIANIEAPRCSCMALAPTDSLETTVAFLKQFAAKYPVVLLTRDIDMLKTQQLYALGAQEILDESRLDSIQIHRAISAAIQRKVYAEHGIEEAALANLSGEVKSIFMGLMSHELRTPLNGISLAAELIAMGTLDEDQSEMIGTINACSRQLARMISEILDFTLLEQERTSALKAEFRLKERISALAGRFEERCVGKSIAFRLILDPDISDRCLGDMEKLEQVLINLLSNAFRHTQAGGEISLELRLLETRESEQLLQFTVLDTGEGIDQVRQERIFHIFSRAIDRFTCDELSGLGLGLPIAARLVTLLGGTMWVDSAPAEGSSFHFTCPLRVISAPAERAQSGPYIISDHGLSGKHILLVEESLAHQRIVATHMRRWGCQVTIAQNAKAARKLLEKELFAAVLVDMGSAEVDDRGTHLARKIYEDAQHTPPNKPVYVAISSGLTEAELTRFHQAGFDDCVGKPYRSDELLQTLTRHLCD